MNETLLQRIKQRYGIVGNAEGLNRAIDVALKIAPVDLSVLIMGENGVGKEIFPRIIHDNSARKTKKYFAVNCGAIPEGTIDSELFGHEKGAFTGAVEKREGYFSVANGGTLFLDEVGELPLQTQARLLRVLETGEFIPVGSSQVKKTDVRIVAATNVNMDRAISDGKFREDLYYRLNSILITIPPLRERGEDATLLFRKFALDMSEKYKMPPIRLTEDAKAVLMHYSWPGNIRQLRNVAENMSVTAEEREITAEVLRQYIPEERPHNQLVVSDPHVKEHSFENEREILYQILFDLRRDVTELKKTVNEQLKGQSCDLSDRKGLPAFNSHYVDPQTFAEAEEVRDGEETKPILSLEEQEREAIGRVLEQNKGNRKLTAEQLGISERTLYRKIKEYDLEN
ncbi:sigma-54 dependent transcriptional regulator [Alloprevotella tannerae]|jgi:sigma-54 dependent transcriptional regulator|uniref:sigma-54 interaction domain-containing protein n=1 Tax=Alloprevotella tannerae TaxID=76122 RepID=UPI0028E6D489|nr:sigma-54 dependent transcriptional regulator [Alloprevotella tannerae]